MSPGVLAELTAFKRGMAICSTINSSGFVYGMYSFCTLRMFLACLAWEREW